MGTSSSESIRLYHLLVKHNKSRRPSSWRESHITRTESGALRIIQDYQAQIGGDFKKFKEFAEKFSDCSSAKREGDLGPVKRGDMQRPFEDAGFALSIGQMSGPVTTESGIHLIYRQM